MTDLLKTTFKDKTEREWDLRLNAPIVKDVKEQLGVKLTSFEEDPLDKLSTDPVLLVDVLYLICKEQADARDMTSRQFGECLNPDLEGVVEALLAAIVGFFPPGKRSAVLGTLRANEKLVTDAQTQLLTSFTNEEKMKALATRLATMGEAQIQKSIERALIDTAD